MFAKMLRLFGETGRGGNMSIVRFERDGRLALSLSNGQVIAVWETRVPWECPEVLRAHMPADSLLKVEAASVDEEGTVLIDGAAAVFLPLEDAKVRDAVLGTLRSYILPGMAASEIVDDPTELDNWELHVAAETLFVKFWRALGEPILKKTGVVVAATMPGEDDSMWHVITLREQALVAPRVKTTEPVTVKKEKTVKEKPAVEVKVAEIVEPAAEAAADQGVAGMDDVSVEAPADAHVAAATAEQPASAPVPPKAKRTPRVAAPAAVAPEQRDTGAAVQAAQQPQTIEAVVTALETEFFGFVARTKELFRQARQAIKEKGKARDQSELLKRSQQLQADMAKALQQLQEK